MKKFDALEISIVMANWNGVAFLEKALSTLWRSAEAANRSFELVVVDDASSDASVASVREKFPQVHLIENERNMGFAQTCNRGAEAARGRIVAMVNNDVSAPEEFVSRLVAPFFDDEGAQDEAPLFAVGAKTVEIDGVTPNQLCMTAAWRRGGIGKEWSDPLGPTRATYVQGGSTAYDRELFLRLGGFDPIYHPAYWEDYDLSYRACKCGWTVLYEPRATLIHLGKASMSKRFGFDRIARIDESHRLWFNWLNLDDRALLCRHIAAIPWICVRDIVGGKGSIALFGLLRALGGLPRIVQRRRERRRTDPAPRRTDRELMGPSSNVWSME